jgi:hypothetical protein
MGLLHGIQGKPTIFGQKPGGREESIVFSLDRIFDEFLDFIKKGLALFKHLTMLKIKYCFLFMSSYPPALPQAIYAWSMPFP